MKDKKYSKVRDHCHYTGEYRVAAHNIESAKFMASSLSNLVNNLSEGIYRIKCKFGHDDEICEACGIKYKYCNSFLEYTNFNYDLIKCKRLCCNKN